MTDTRPLKGEWREGFDDICEGLLAKLLDYSLHIPEYNTYRFRITEIPRVVLDRDLNQRIDVQLHFYISEEKWIKHDGSGVLDHTEILVENADKVGMKYLRGTDFEKKCIVDGILHAYTTACPIL